MPQIKHWEDYPIQVVKLKDKNYPCLLKEINDPPAKLYYKGRLPAGEYTAVAVVGSRKYTSYGKQAAEELTGSLARRGIIIVSGLALGIDSLAHQAALETPSITWAVLARGLDGVYPASHYGLACRILAAGGTVFSEEAIGTPAEPFRFLQRNRLIAGLSQATLVIEAAERSGTLITARFALDYNRSVLAVPQNIYNFTSKGTNRLIAQGARLVLAADDILDELGIEIKSYHRKIVLTEMEKKICQAIKNEPLDADAISRQTHIRIDRLNAGLIMMVINGIIKKLENGTYGVPGYADSPN